MTAAYLRVIVCYKYRFVAQKLSDAELALPSLAAPSRRDPRFASVQDADLAFFRGVLGPTGVITDPTTLEGYNRDWMRKYEGHSRVALRPTTTEQVCGYPAPFAHALAVSRRTRV